MSEKTFDPAAFRKIEREGWKRLYVGYHQHWEHLTTQVIPQMLDATGAAGSLVTPPIAAPP